MARTAVALGGSALVIHMPVLFGWTANVCLDPMLLGLALALSIAGVIVGMIGKSRGAPLAELGLWLSVAALLVSIGHPFLWFLNLHMG